jgi:hypothetical protein
VYLCTIARLAITPQKIDYQGVMSDTFVETEASPLLLTTILDTRVQIVTRNWLTQSTW